MMTCNSLLKLVCLKNLIQNFKYLNVLNLIEFNKELITSYYGNSVKSERLVIKLFKKFVL